MKYAWIALLMVTGCSAKATAPSPTPPAPLTNESYAASVVKITNGEETGGGTGWSAVSHGKPVVVTNDHVCSIETGGYLIVHSDSGAKTLKKILKRSLVRDLCLLQGIDAPALKIGSEAPKRFDEVWVMGHPLLEPTAPARGVFTGTAIESVGLHPDSAGNCADTSEKVESMFGTFCIQKMELSLTTVPIYPGNSGSPVVNQKGEVIGVINSAGQSNQGGFVPLTYLKEMLDE